MLIEGAHYRALRSKNSHEFCCAVFEIFDIQILEFSKIGVPYTRYYVMKAYYYSNLEEVGRTIQGDILINETSLNEVVR